MKKGFTLIEILAIIIILAVITLLATPIVLDVVDNARSEANKETVYGIIQAGKNYYAESLLDDIKKEEMDGKTDIYNNLIVSGEKPENGNLFVNDDGRVSAIVVIDNKCYKKTFEGQLEELEAEDPECNYKTIINDTESPTIDYEIDGLLGNNNWYTTEVYVTINATDELSGIKEYSWCSTVDENCEPTNKETTSKKLEVLNGYKVCAKAVDKSSNESGIVCTEVFNIDTISPEFEGIEDKTIAKDEEIDLKEGVSVSDSLSGMEGIFTVTPEEVDTTKTGTTEVKYVAIDKAGNIKEVTRKIIVSADAPSVIFTADTEAINELGWAKEDFYVTINVIDNSGHGIKEFKVCTITGNDECNPANGSVITDSTNTIRLISTESNNNRICVQATDKAEKRSETICSDAYKLDKTSPVAGNIKVNNSSTIASWYTSDITITPIDGTDELSGHLETTSNIDSIKENTNGTTVTVTTTDKAGNVSTREYIIKVDKTQPTCTFTTLSYLGENKTATIDLTCTNTVSGISDKQLTASDFTVSNATITNVSRNAVTNGYKYTITLKGTTAGTSTVTLPANKVTTVARLGNAAKTSGNITITNVILSSTSGTGYVGGSDLTSTITSSNAGTLSCTSSNTSVATCSISGTTLTIVPKVAGTATITVTGANGSPTAIYTITSKVVTLGLSSTNGTGYVGGNNLTSTITSSNAGTITCSSNNTSIATCTVSGTTLTIIPGSTTGTTTITVKESRLNKMATYTVTVDTNVVKGVQVNCSSYGTFPGKSCPSGQTIYVLDDVKYCLDYTQSNPLDSNSSEVSSCLSPCYSSYDCTTCYGSYGASNHDQCMGIENCKGCYSSCGQANSNAYNSCLYNCRYSLAFTKCKNTYKIYGVTLDNQSPTTTGTTYVDAVYNKAMISIKVPVKTGYTFGGYYTGTNGSGIQYYDSNGNGVRKYDKTSTLTLYAKWTANKYTVTLDNQSPTTYGTTSTTATYDSSLPNITIPIKTGYDFLGYYTGKNGTGTRVYTETGTGISIWKYSSNTTLYAYWIANTVTVTCSDYSGYVPTTCINGTAPVSGKVKYCLDYTKANYSSLNSSNNSCMSSCNVCNCSCSSCTTESDCSSCGAYCSNQCNGIMVSCQKSCAYSPCKSTLKIYSVTLDNQSATTTGTLKTDVAYGSPMPDVVVPTRTGYTFGGYYTSTNGGGTQYYNASGKSVRNYDKTAALTLYAKWTANKYTLTLNNQSATSTGTTSVTATYDSSLPSINIPTKTGYDFLGYYTGTNGTGTRIYTETGAGINIWRTTSSMTLYAYWIANTVTVTCSDYSGYVPTTCINGTAPVSGKVKYCLDYTKANYSSLNSSNNSCMSSCNVCNCSCSSCTTPSDCSSCGSYCSNQCNGIMVSCQKSCAYSPCKSTLKIYSVTLDNQSATTTGTLKTDVAYGSPMPDVVVPTRTGYTFGGYYTGANGSGTQYYNASGKSVRNYDKTAAITLYAKWTANKYTITLNNQSATTSGTTSTTATYDSAMPSITLPTKSGYDFLGYYTEANGKGTQYYTYKGVSTRNFNLTSNTTLYAYWVSNNTSVSCSTYGFASLTCTNGTAIVNGIQKHCLDYTLNNYSSMSTSNSCMSSCNICNCSCSGCNSESSCSSCGSYCSSQCNGIMVNCQKNCTYSTCLSSFN